MSPKEKSHSRVDRVNRYEYERLAEFHIENYIKHQTPNGIQERRVNIRNMFIDELKFEMAFKLENVFKDGNEGKLVWKDPVGHMGCGFFWIENDQKGYLENIH